MIKLCAPVVMKLLVVCFNEMFDSESFPDKCKIAKLIALFKSASETDFYNYRPFSLLSAISKIFEKLIYRRMVKFLQKYKILCPEKFGFRQKHSCVQAISRIVEYMRSVLERRDSGMALFLDFKKAFDTVDHDILIIKLEKHGFRGNFLNLLKIYLVSRVKFVSDCIINSSFEKITFGVLQGSVLGPLLFLIYINDFSNVTKTTEISLFGDETAIVGSGKTRAFSKEFRRGTQSLNDWCNVNKLSINTDKSKLMGFGKAMPDASISIAGENMENKEIFKYLGIEIDKKLICRL